MRFLIFCMGIAVFLGSCKNKNRELCGLTGSLKDLRGQDGCAWVIETDEGDVFSPSNIYEFGFNIYAGQRAHFSYQINPEGEQCLFGPTVILVCFDPIN